MKYIGGSTHTEGRCNETMLSKVTSEHIQEDKQAFKEKKVKELMDRAEAKGAPITRKLALIQFHYLYW